MISIKVNRANVIFSVYVLPRSSKVCIVGSHQKALKVKLTAPPVGGAANKQCIKLLAKTLGLPKSAITITSGKTNRLKQITIQPMTPDVTTSELKALEDKINNLAQKTS